MSGVHYPKAAFQHACSVLAGQTDTLLSHRDLNLTGIVDLFNENYVGMAGIPMMGGIVLVAWG